MENMKVHTHKPLSQEPSASGSGSSDDNPVYWKLACPYFKYDLRRYGSHKGCRGPEGWRNVHRLKEHLYRRHAIVVCPRCRRSFQTQQDLTLHARAAEVCPQQDERDFGDGFDSYQKELLKSRRRKQNLSGEPDYWKSVYQILFPNVDKINIPEPFYDVEGFDYQSYDKACAQARRKDDVLRSELVRRVWDPVLVDEILEVFDNHQTVIRTTVLAGDGASPNATTTESDSQPQADQDMKLIPSPIKEPLSLSGEPLSVNNAFSSYETSTGPDSHFSQSPSIQPRYQLLSFQPIGSSHPFKHGAIQASDSRRRSAFEDAVLGINPLYESQFAIQDQRAATMVEDVMLGYLDTLLDGIPLDNAVQTFNSQQKEGHKEDSLFWCEEPTTSKKRKYNRM